MKILLFHTELRNTILSNLKKKIKEISPDLTIDQCNTFNKLIDNLKDISEISNIIVLVIKNVKELERLDTIKGLIKNRPLVIVISNNKDLIVKKALKFLPRYIGFLDSSYNETILVLCKMLNKIQNAA
jgi:hypothetical protein